MYDYGYTVTYQTKQGFPRFFLIDFMSYTNLTFYLLCTLLNEDVVRIDQLM